MTTTWDEPPDCTTARGWLNDGTQCVGFYLDYGPDLYRAETHTHLWRQYLWAEAVDVVRCTERHLCRQCQPGNILAVRYPNGPGTAPKDSRWCETIADAKQWVLTGQLAWVRPPQPDTIQEVNAA